MVSDEAVGTCPSGHLDKSLVDGLLAKLAKEEESMPSEQRANYGTPFAAPVVDVVGFGADATTTAPQMHELMRYRTKRV